MTPQSLARSITNGRQSRRLARLVARAGRRMGVSVTLYPPRNSLELALTTLFRVRQVNCVLDVGACAGQYARFLRERVGYKGHIVSFEPDEANFGSLRCALGADPRWRGFPFALGREAGVGQLNVYGYRTLSSLLQPSEFGAERYPELGLQRGVERVEIHSLDDVVDAATEGIHKPQVFLKVDTQGYDVQVLEGAGTLLQRLAGIQLELSAKPIYAGQPTFETVCTRLREWGFELAAMVPISYDRDEVRVIELDAVFSRAP